MIRRRRCYLPTTIATFVMFALISSSPVRGQLLDWESFDFTKRVVDVRTLEKLPLSKLKLLRGMVFGRHGRVFVEREIQNYLYSTAWYKPDAQFNNSQLNDIERQNLDLIRRIEAQRHRQIEPGDLRFWQERRFTRNQLGNHTPSELRIMRAEIEAIHGRHFYGEPVLQNYFEERYWYRRSDAYDSAQLSDTERRNIATIASAEKKQHRVKLAQKKRARRFLEQVEG